jgi:succinate dehydrogenase / fumarate reductase flavoprotein subunit
LLVFGKRAGEHAAIFAKSNAAGRIDERQVETVAKHALGPFERGQSGDNPFKIQQELQGMMQDLVGIVREEAEMRRALDALQALKAQAERAGVTGHREYNNGWHTALDLGNLLVVSEAITLSALERKESRGGHFRADHPDKDPAFGSFNIVVRRSGDGSMHISHVPIPPLPSELKQVIEENH